MNFVRNIRYPVTCMVCIVAAAHAVGADSSPSEKPYTIVAFGDSTTAPRKTDDGNLVIYADIMRREIAQQGVEAMVVNAGVGSDTTVRARNRFETDVLAHDPDLVIIQFGLNDSAIDVHRGKNTPRVLLRDYVNNLSYFVDTLRARDIRVVLMTPNPMLWTDQLKKLYGAAPYDAGDRLGFNLLNRQYAATVQALAVSARVPLVDVYQRYLDYDAQKDRSMDDLLLDGMHPNNRGHAMTAGLLMKRIAEIGFSRAEYRRQLSSGLYETDLFILGEHGVAEYRIPALAVTQKGTLIAVCDARVPRPGDLPNNIDLVMRRSFDLGKTWTPMQTISDFPGMEGGGDPSLLVDRDTGRVWLFYVYGPEGIGTAKSQPGLDGPTLQLHLRYSDDDGATWSAPRNINPEVKNPEWKAVWSSPGRGIQTRSGRLYFPLSRSLDVHFTHQIYSDDHGKTWRMSAAVGKNTNESMIVELADGTLMVNMRSNHEKNRRAVARSVDNGATWSGINHDEELIEAVCQASLIRYTMASDGDGKNRLLFSNPASTKRENMTVRLSYDEGKTWPVSKVIYPGPSAYSCLAALPDGSVGLFYERGVGSPYEKITFLRFTLEWLTDGEDALDRNNEEDN